MKDELEELRQLAQEGEDGVYDYLKDRELVSKDLIKKVQGKPKSHILSDHYPHEIKLDRDHYEDEKKKLQTELVKFQRHVKSEREKYIVVCEGRDAAGKGGTIKRFMEHLNPRMARVVALDKPNEAEKGQWYFQRYVNHLPTHGEIVFFDRSWYNRSGVERVMNFCSDDQYVEFVSQVPKFESMIQRSHINMVKFWFSVSREEQLRRFVSRITDPLKQWKISPMDIQSLPLWNDYTEAKESQFFYTDTDESPWVVIRSDCKKRARLNAMRYVLDKFAYADKDETMIGKLDTEIIGPAKDIYEEDELLHRDQIKKKNR